jgi:hypothetical protein
MLALILFAIAAANVAIAMSSTSAVAINWALAVFFFGVGIYCSIIGRR